MLQSHRFVFLLFIIALMAGCSRPMQNNQAQKNPPANQTRNISEAEPSKAKSQAASIKSLSEYLGLKPDRHWEYLGEGNEYASFTADVTHVKGNLYQIEENNGGTLLARVIALRTDGAYEILTQGEHPSKLNLLDDIQVGTKETAGKKLIPWPLRKGTTWTQPDGSSATVRSTNLKRDVPFGDLRNVLQIEVTSPPRPAVTIPSGEISASGVASRGRKSDEERSVVDFYYVRGIGLVERTFTMGDTMVTSKLRRTTLISE